MWSNDTPLGFVSNDVAAISAVNMGSQVRIKRQAAVANCDVRYPAPINIQPTSAMSQHVFGHGAHQRLARHGDRL